LTDNRKVFAFCMIAIMTLAFTMPFMLAQPTTGLGQLQITPSLELNLMTRQGNTLRIAWADLVAQNMKSIGITADRVTVPKTTFNDRAMEALPSVRG